MLGTVFTAVQSMPFPSSALRILTHNLYKASIFCTVQTGSSPLPPVQMKEPSRSYSRTHIPSFGLVFRLKEGAKDILSADSWVFGESSSFLPPSRSCECISSFHRTCYSSDILLLPYRRIHILLPWSLWNAEERRLFVLWG
jgi:hypothetical protein